jgi:hypothetical protein
MITNMMIEPSIWFIKNEVAGLKPKNATTAIAVAVPFDVPSNLPRTSASKGIYLGIITDMIKSDYMHTF